MTSEKPICKIADCKNISKTKGLCVAHYHRLLRHGCPLKGLPRKGERQRFIKEAAESKDLVNCILWPYPKSAAGYGRVHMFGKMMYAHRVALILTQGEPKQSSMEASHRPLVCHNRSCVNPNHLSWKTRAQNHEDMREDATMCLGEKSSMSKINAVQALSIFKDLRPYKVISENYGVSIGSIANIKYRKTWRHVTQGMSPQYRRSDKVS